MRGPYRMRHARHYLAITPPTSSDRHQSARPNHPSATRFDGTPNAAQNSRTHATTSKTRAIDHGESPVSGTPNVAASTAPIRALAHTPLHTPVGASRRITEPVSRGAGPSPRGAHHQPADPFPRHGQPL